MCICCCCCFIDQFSLKHFLSFSLCLDLFPSHLHTLPSKVTMIARLFLASLNIICYVHLGAWKQNSQLHFRAKLVTYPDVEGRPGHSKATASVPTSPSRSPVPLSTRGHSSSVRLMGTEATSTTSLPSHVTQGGPRQCGCLDTTQELGQHNADIRFFFLFTFRYTVGYEESSVGLESEEIFQCSLAKLNNPSSPNTAFQFKAIAQSKMMNEHA